jgi:hypothetical protein
MIVNDGSAYGSATKKLVFYGPSLEKRPMAREPRLIEGAGRFLLKNVIQKIPLHPPLPKGEYFRILCYYQ